MSDYVLSASLELRDKFTTTIKSAVSEFKKMDTDIGSVTSAIKKKFKDMELDTSKGLKNMQSSFNNFAKNTAVGMVTGSGVVGAFLKSSYMGFVELDEQLTRNAAITSATAEEQAKLKKQVDDLGASTKYTAFEVAQAQMYQAMAGYKTNEILEVTPTLMKLAIATGEDLAATSDMVTDNLSAFGLSVRDAGMFADILANVANNTNTTVGMLGNAFTYVGATSSAVGENFREVATILGILADNGIKGEKAGTALRGLYTRLANPTSEMQKQLKKVGLELYDQNGKFKGLRKIIEESRPALEKLTEEERNQWLTIIAGTEGITGWTAVLNNSIESTEKAEKAAYNATGALEKFVGVMSKTDRQKIDELSSAFDGFKQKLGEALSPIILENVQELTTYLNEMTNSDDFSTKKIEEFFKKIEKYSKLAAGGVIAFNAATLFARALAGDPKAWTTLAGLSVMGGAYAGYKIANKYFDADKEKDKKIERDYYYQGVWRQVEENRELHYNYELPKIEDKGYNGAVATEILSRNNSPNINYGPRVENETNVFENSIGKTDKINSEKTFNYNISLDFKGLNENMDTKTLTDATTQTLYEIFKNSNERLETQS